MEKEKKMKFILTIYLSSILFSLAPTKIVAEDKSSSNYHLGSKFQIENTIFQLFDIEDQGKRSKLSSKITELVIMYAKAFGGACDLYELPYSAFELIEVANSVGYEGATFTTRIKEGNDSTRCQDMESLKIPTSAKNATRAALMIKLCYEITHDPDDTYGAQEHLEKIMCKGQCDSDSEITVSNIQNLYTHFYPYRIINQSDFGELSDWGVAGKSKDQSVKILGTAFCMDPHWTHF